MRRWRELDLRPRRVLDGAFATELEARGVSTAGPLWSARALFEAPEVVLAVHWSYLEAGAEILLTGTYQASMMGFTALGFGPVAAREQADGALRRGVELALTARREFGGVSLSGKPVLVAASLGPYGAALANGAEFTGSYELGSEAEEFSALVAFHAERIDALAGTEADLLAFETVPKLLEARAIATALSRWPEVGAWVSFTCRDGALTAHGEPVRECAALLDGVPQIVAVGVNCVAPALVLPLLAELRAGTGKPLVVYPNSGEGWDAEARCWTGSSDAAGFGELARAWFAAGASVVGGCCRTGPGHVRWVASLAECNTA